MLLQICAAASLTIVLPKISPDAKYTFDASSKISKQARAGAKCDVVIVADDEWAKWLEAEGKKGWKLLSARKTIAETKLVWVQPLTAEGWPRTFADVIASPPKRLGLGGEAVPIGRYAEKALRAAGAWDAVQKRIVRAENDRALLTWVTRADVDAGIVYLSDAFSEPKVRTSFVIDEKVQYFAFSLSKGGADYVDHLSAPEAVQMLMQNGFEVPR